MKNLGRVCIGLIAALLWLTGSGASHSDPSELGQLLGFVMRAVAVILVFLTFYYWRMTALESLKFEKHRIGAGVILVVMGLLLVWSGASGLFLLDFLAKVGGYQETIMISITVGLVTAMVGAAIFLRKTWSNKVANILMFVFACGNVVGLLIALYIWRIADPTGSDSHKSIHA